MTRDVLSHKKHGEVVGEIVAVVEEQVVRLRSCQTGSNGGRSKTTKRRVTIPQPYTPFSDSLNTRE